MLSAFSLHDPIRAIPIFSLTEHQLRPISIFLVMAHRYESSCNKPESVKNLWRNFDGAMPNNVKHQKRKRKSCRGRPANGIHSHSQLDPFRVVVTSLHLGPG